MHESSLDSSLPLADAETAVQEPEQDPAGGITLSGRNRLCARARVLAGMGLTSGLVIALGALDTTSSMHQHL